MNQQAVWESAVRLQSLLTQYAPTSQSARALQKALTPWIDAALAGCIQEPVDTRDIPDGRTFEETDVRDTAPDLEHAFAVFRTEMSGGEPKYMKAFRERHGMSR